MIGQLHISLTNQLPSNLFDNLSLLQNKEEYNDVRSFVEALSSILNSLQKETILLSLNLMLDIAPFSDPSMLISFQQPLSVENNPDELLSKREKEVLRLVFDGLTNKEIAGKLFISFETVKSHRKNILAKTGSKNTAALVKTLRLSELEDLKK